MTKHIQDPIHGLMSLDKRLFQLIDTPEFQRLRSIKQLGTTYQCFPSATHTRFTHSIGTCYLTGQIYDNYRSFDPDYDIDPLVVQSAGLLHDIGHGPFSHVFEKEVVPTLLGDNSWNHEEQGLRMIDHLIDKNYIDLFDSSEIAQIKGLITGQMPSELSVLNGLVANHQYGIDADRLDYLKRDCYSVGISCGFYPQMLMTYTRPFAGRPHFHVKKKNELYQFFHTRYTLYKQIYNHHISKAIEYMIADALIAANPIIGLKQMVEDPELYINLNDSILDLIKTNPHPELNQSRQILRRIDQRKFYKCVDSFDHYPSEKDLENFDKPIIQHLKIDYGTGDQNPMTLIPFYNDAGETFQLGPSECGMLMPQQFEEEEYRIFIR